MREAAVIALVTFGCLCELICVAGLLWFRDVFDQLHFSGAASTVGLLALGVAVVLTGFHDAAGTVDCVVALFLVFLLSPVMIAATGRTARRIRYSGLEPRAGEFERQP